MADIIGIGNPLMDILVQVNHDKLKEIGLDAGTMHLVSDEKIMSLLSSLPDGKLAPGGSVANTIAGIAALGGSSMFIGSVGMDDHAEVFETEMKKGNAKASLAKSNGITGKALTLVTDDAQRTFVVNLGVALNLKKEHIDEEKIKNAKYLYVSGFELEDENMRSTVLHAMDIAKANGVKIALDLADPSLIKRAYPILKEVFDNYIDIIFANETEAEAFTGKQPHEALDELANNVEIAVVKLGEMGSIVKMNDRVTKINSFKAEAIDTTGAGDMYAAGFLYGLSQNYNIDLCGKISSYASSLVVSQIGARLESSIKDEVDRLKNEH